MQDALKILLCFLGRCVGAAIYTVLSCLKGHFANRENKMLAKIHIVTPIEKQIVSALQNRFPLLDCTPQTRNMEKRSGSGFKFNIQSFLRFVVGEQRLHISVIIRRWSFASLDEFVVRRWLN